MTAGVATSIPVTWLTATTLAGTDFFNLAAAGTNVPDYVVQVAAAQLSGTGVAGTPYSSSAMTLPSNYASTGVVPKIFPERCAPSTVGTGSTCVRATAGNEISPPACSSGRKLRL